MFSSVPFYDAYRFFLFCDVTLFFDLVSHLCDDYNILVQFCCAVSCHILVTSSSVWLIMGHCNSLCYASSCCGSSLLLKFIPFAVLCIILCCDSSSRAFQSLTEWKHIKVYNKIWLTNSPFDMMANFESFLPLLTSMAKTKNNAPPVSMAPSVTESVAVLNILDLSVFVD